MSYWKKVSPLGTGIESEKIQKLLDMDWSVLFTDGPISASIVSAPPDSPCKVSITKTEGILDDIEVEEMIALFQTTSIRPLLDNRTEAIHVKQVKEDYTIVHALSKPIWPASARDLLVKINPTYYDPNLGGFVISQSSIHDDRYPSPKGFVRAFAHLSINIIQPLEKGIKLVSIGQLDIGGTVPKSLVNFGLRAAPQGISKLLTYGRSVGFPPKLVAIKGDGVFLKSEAFDPNTRLYYAEVVCSMDGTEKRLRIDPKLYPQVHMKLSDGIEHSIENNFLHLQLKNYPEQIFIVIGQNHIDVEHCFQSLTRTHINRK